MSDDEIDKFYKAVEVVEKLGGLFRAAIASAFAVCGCVAAIAIWVHNTDARAEQTQRDLSQLSADRNDRLREWDQWRKEKDAIDIRLALIVDNQQKLLDRIIK